MDGDDAGRNAVERLCGGNVLSRVTELNADELYVATLPDEDGVKDPSDFVEYAGRGEKARARFQEEVLDRAVPWDEWYVSRILSRHDEAGGSSFSEVCDEVSSFLATFPSPADRTRRAHAVAEMLADLISKGDGGDGDDEGRSSSSSSRSMLRVQLELDVLNMASRKAGAREAMERRIEGADGASGAAALAARMESLSSGGGGDAGGVDGDGDGRLSRSALARAARPRRVDEDSARRGVPVAPPRSSRQGARAAAAARSFPAADRKPRDRRQLPERHLVPHFSGFSFKHQTDRDWLGLSGNGVSCC